MFHLKFYCSALKRKRATPIIFSTKAVIFESKNIYLRNDFEIDY